jgi:hypothetical protein
MADFDFGAPLPSFPTWVLAEALALVCQPRFEESGFPELVFQTAENVVGTDTMGLVDGCNRRE